MTPLQFNVQPETVYTEQRGGVVTQTVRNRVSSVQNSSAIPVITIKTFAGKKLVDDGALMHVYFMINLITIY